MEARAYSQNEVFDAAVQFAKAQGIVPAPERMCSVAWNGVARAL